MPETTVTSFSYTGVKFAEVYREWWMPTPLRLVKIGTFRVYLTCSLALDGTDRRFYALVYRRGRLIWPRRLSEAQP